MKNEIKEKKNMNKINLNSLIRNLLLSFTIISFTNCSSNEERKREEFYKNSPSGFTELINSKKMAKLRPVQIIQFLKKNCCDAVMIEPTNILHWTEEDIKPLQEMIGDESFVAPVVTTSGTFSCRGPTYMSTIDREARHLIMAYKQKTYPLAQCSTLDLKLDPIK